MPFSYPVSPVKYNNLLNDYPNLWETIKKEFPKLTVSEWIKIASLVIGTCGHCHDNAIGCQCENDE